MIRRFVFFRFRPEIDADAARAAVADAVRSTFPGIPGVLRALVGRPADEHAAAGWDLSLTVDFESLDDVPGYLEHPAHVAFVEAELAPRTLVKKAWNFELL